MTHDLKPGVRYDISKAPEDTYIQLYSTQCIAFPRKVWKAFGKFSYLLNGCDEKMIAAELQEFTKFTLYPEDEKVPNSWDEYINTSGGFIIRNEHNSSWFMICKSTSTHQKKDFMALRDFLNHYYGDKDE